MGHLILQNDNFAWPGFSLLDERSLAITMDDLGPNFQQLDFLVLSGTRSVSIASIGAVGGVNLLLQLEETTDSLKTVTISGNELFSMGNATGQINTDDGVVTDIAAPAGTTIHSSLKLIDASATTGGVQIGAGATNTSGAGNFIDGESLNADVTITYTGLTIKGGSGTDSIENDAEKGIVIDGNGNQDFVILGGADVKATLGSGTGDHVDVGLSSIGTVETPGTALGDKVTFGDPASASLQIHTGAEAGATAGTTNIGLTEILKRADGLEISIFTITNSATIVDETAAVASSTSLTAAENAAVKEMAGAGVAYFTFHGNEYFIATNNNETAVSSNDAIVELVGITNIHHPTNAGGFVTLHV